MPRKEKVGTVVSNKMEKTIVVAVQERHAHSKYGKIQNKTVKFMAHDPENTCHQGDTVRIIENRPLSKNKKWQLKEVVERVAEVSA